MKLLRAGDAARAEKALEAAVEAGLSDTNLYIALGRARAALHRPEGAVEAFSVAVELSGGHPQALTNLANAQRRALKSEAAIESYRRALKAAPRHLPALLGLGNAALEIGDTSLSERAFRDALAVEPSYAKAFSSLAKVLAKRPAEESAALLEHFLALLNRGSLEPADQLLAHHGVALILDGQGRYDEAFVHFRAFNRLRRARFAGATRAARRAELDARLAGNARVFSPGFRLRDRLPPDAEPRPLFIVGMPRSATTLVEQILCADPSVRGGGERVDIQRLSAELEPLDDGYVIRLEQSADRLRKSYLSWLAADAGDASLVTDKMPFNFWHIGLILTLFPGARVIHTRRDPRDTCLSCYFHNFTQPFAFVSDLRELGEYYCAYREQMADWEKLYPGSILSVDQATLLAEPEQTIRKIVAFAGLTWSDRFLSHQNVARPVLTASSLQVRERLNPSYVGRWRRYEAHIGPLLEALEPVLADAGEGD